MIEKIEVGKEYIDGEGLKIKVTAVGEQNILYTFSSTEYSEAISFALDTLSQLPNAKVKRAKYLYKNKKMGYPEESSHYFIDQKEFLSSSIYSKKDFDFIIRLQETEREFDV